VQQPASGETTEPSDTEKTVPEDSEAEEEFDDLKEKEVEEKESEEEETRELPGIEEAEDDPAAEDVPEPVLADCSRPSGFFMGNTYYVRGSEKYRIQVENSAETEILCKYGNTTETMSQEGSAYTWTVPQELDAFVQMGYVSQTGDFGGERSVL
jgi:hypothetical protein